MFFFSHYIFEIIQAMIRALKIFFSDWQAIRLGLYRFVASSSPTYLFLLHQGIHPEIIVLKNQWQKRNHSMLKNGEDEIQFH